MRSWPTRLCRTTSDSSAVRTCHRGGRSSPDMATKSIVRLKCCGVRVGVGARGGDGRLDPPELLSLLARSLAGTDADRPLSTRLCEACVDIFHVQGGALTVSAVESDRVAVSTPGQFEHLEPLQEVLGEGPVPQAMATNQPVAMDLGGLVDEYPVFSHLAGSVGDGATLYAVPMRASGRSAGVLSLYATDESEVRSTANLQFVADAVGAVLLGNLDLLDWSERTPYHRAVGMVVAQLGVSPAEASTLIRAHAFSRSTSLLAVAQDVLERRVAFSPNEW